MRADMTPEQVRAAGIYLNGGRRRGWKQRLAGLLDTPQATISAWSTRSQGNARPIPGVAAVAIKLLVAMMRQELMVTAHPDQAGKAVAERLMILLGQPQPVAADERPITVENLRRPAGAVQRAPLLGVKPPGARHEQLIEPHAASASERDRPETPVALGIRPGERRGRPGSAA
jgi:hypothetical protein